MPTEIRDIAGASYPASPLLSQFRESAHGRDDQGSAPRHGLECSKGRVLVRQRWEYEESSSSEYLVDSSQPELRPSKRA